MFRLILFLFSFLVARLALDVGTIIANLRDDDDFNAAANDPRAQFIGPRGRTYLGPQILPESLREENFYEEEDFELIQDVIASDVDAHSPPVFKRGAERRLVFEVKLGDSGVALQMTAKDYSTIVRLLGRDAPMQSIADTVMDFNGNLVNAATVYNEVQRWGAIIDGEITRVVGNTEEPITYPNATGQRTPIVGAWTSDSYDPFDDIFAALDWGADLGFERISRIITTRTVVQTLLGNDIVIRRSGNFVQVGTDVFANRADEAKLQTYLGQNNFPQLETYDTTYRDQDGVYRFIPEDVFIVIFETGRENEEALDAAELAGRPFVPEDFGGTIGYVGIGTTAGHEDRGPGKYVNVRFVDEARPRVVGEMVQKSLPVFTEPNGFLVYTGIH